jgi:hypothetical protein
LAAHRARPLGRVPTLSRAGWRSDCRQRHRPWPLKDGVVDFAFASNLFEHLIQKDFAATPAARRRKLLLQGTLNILQPNYRDAYREYFDDYTHVAVYSHISLAD